MSQKTLARADVGEGEKVEDEEPEKGEEEESLAYLNIQLNLGSIASMTSKKSLKLGELFQGEGWWYWWILVHDTNSYPRRQWTLYYSQ